MAVGDSARTAERWEFLDLQEAGSPARLERMEGL
jgi:hypothetical protein